MKRTTLGVVSASTLSLLLAGPAIAAGDQAKQSQAGTGMQQQAQAPEPQKDFLANNMIGKEVQNRQGETLGEISNLIVKPDGKVSHVVVESGGIAGVGAEKYAVPYDRVQISKQQEVAILDVPQDQLSTEFSAFEEERYQEQQQQQQQQQEPMREEPGTEPMVQ